MKSENLLIALCVVCIFVQQPGLCQTFDGECSTDDGTYSGKRNVTNTGKACYPWRSDNKCFKGITDVNSTFSHNYCRNPVDPSDCHQDLPWCYTDQNNGNWEFCDLPNCGSEPPGNCSSPLGMGDGRIADDQIFAPTFMDQSSMAKYARLNQTNANFWRASWSYPQYAYLSVNLRTPHFITKIHIQGTNYYFIERFKILYSLDGYQWEYYTENKDDPNSAREFEGNHAGYDISIAYIKYPFIASRIAIIPVSFSNVPTLRIELFGCVSTTNIPLVTQVTIIDSNTYWDLDRSPYIISAPTTIPPGVLLTIEADVKVIFTKPTASLTIYGCLELRGIKGLEVKFLTNNILSHMGFWKNPFNNDESFWNGIFINPDSIGCQISSLKHIIIVGAGITTGLKNIEFNNLKISNSKTGLKLTSINENNVIRDCVFRQNLNGIETPRVGSLSIETSQFIENEIGVSLTYLPFPNEISTNFIFVGTLFRDNNYGIYHGSDCMNIKMNFTVLKSNFSNHREYAISAFQYCETESFYSVVSSVFSSSSIRISSYARDYSLQIQNSTVRDLFGKTGISIESRCKNLTISGCTFANISGYSLRINVDIIDSNIRINSSKFDNNTGDGCIYISGQQTASINMLTNTFLNNLVGNVVNFELPSSSNIILSKNIFKNFQSKYELSNNIIRSSNYSILASDNYWGVDDIDNISSRIFDFYRDSSKSFVEILTYFKDERFNEIVNSQNFQLWSQKNGSVGGRLDGNITLSPSPNLTVTKSIFIPKGLCLEINGPIKLDFLAGRGILVEGGCLKAVEVILTSRESLWNGLIFINGNGSLLLNTSISKTSLALELVNSSVKITESNIDTKNFALITGLNYNMLDVFNSEIICSDYCIRVETSVDVIMNIASSSITSSYDSIFINYVDRLFFNLTETSLKSRYNYVLNFGSGIKSGFAQIFKSKLEGFSNLVPESTIFMIKESNFSSDSSCLQFSENWGSNQKNATISYSVFNCRDFAIVHSSVYYSINSSFIVSDNNFLGGELQIYNRYPSKMIITNNYFNSVLRKDQSFLDLQLTRDYDQTFRIDEVFLENNVFENVVGSGISSVIKMSCFSEPYRSYVSAVYLKNNTFRNNSVTNTILTDCIGLTSEKNILNNPNALYEMKVLGITSNDVPQLMYFTRNFWGENVNDPNVRVYDETNDRTLMKVRIDPWYNDTTMTRMVFRSEGFIKPSGEIGGTLTEDVMLHNKGSAYLVSEDITIPTGLKMIIEAGVQLNFVSGGMNIQGTLVAKGNETNYITFNSRDTNKRWKGLNFQKPISHSLKKLEFGWWQILYNGVWKTISFFENSYVKATADVLCKQAGFKESISQAIFQCNSLSPDDKSKILPCNNISTPNVRIQCTQNNEFSLQECYITESEMTYTFYNITCRQEVTESENYVKLQSKSGKWVSYNEKNNTFQLVNDLLNDEDGLFEQISPCNSGESDCFTIMPLKRPGWYLRLYKSEIVLDLAVNNRNPSTFLTDSSFVRISKTSSEYFYIRVASQSLYLIENNNTLSTSALEPTDETDDAMYSFKFINLDPRSTRKKRDTGLSNLDSESSILQNVKIINADKGLFIRGVPPTLEDIEITDTSSHGIHFRGFFDGERPVILNGSSISNSGGNAMNFDLIGDTRNLKALIGECQFENCNQGCVWWNGAGSLNISKSNFRNFRKSALYANLNVGTSSFNLTIVANTFFSTIAESVVILNNGVCQGCFSVEILENNFINSREFDNNNYNLLEFYSINASFIGNVFDNVTYDVLLYNSNGMSFLFDNNTIRNSRFREILNLYNIASFSVSNNLFINNTYKVYWSKLRTLTISNNNDDLRANITNNSFFNPQSEYDVYVNTNWDTSSYKMLDLSLNKWILRDYARILSKIYCFYNDASKLPVNVWPAIYVQNNSETLLARPTSESTYFFNATGGEVTFSFKIPNATNKYIFQNSILIPANVTLSIEPGTNIEFATGRGIVAYGVMKINSVDGQFINVTKTKKMDFYANESEKFSMGNAVLESDEIKFNSSKLELSNVTFNVKTSVTIISNDAGINNCTFNGVYNGLTWNKLNPDINYDYAVITIHNSTFKKCEKALRVPLTMNETRIVNSTFLDNNEAILLEYNSRPNFTVIIQDSSFKNNRYAIQGSISESGNIEISRCYFKDLQETRAQNLDATGINLGISGAITLLINENVFEENVQPAMKLFRAWNGRTDKQIIILQENQFRNISKTPVTLQNMYGTDIKMYRNKFANNIVDRNVNDKMSAVEYSFTYNLIFYNWPLANVSVTQNSFLSNGGKHVVKTWSSFDEEASLKAKFYKLEFSSNTFFNNFPTDSVIASGLDANFSYNIFSNPLTMYDFIALFPPQMSQNCTMNWWGSANITEIRGRIKDKYQDPSVGQVIYQPYLNKSEFSCEGVNSCSSHGLCVAPDVCQCSSGWDGASCSNYSCSRVYNCLGRGDCVGPDKCFCNNGWSGQDCSMASCGERSNCSGRGICVRPNECMCSEQFSGLNCSECKSGRWGDNCAPCPNCKHGTCNKASGKCDCSSPNWTGELCGECAPKFFGPLCLPLVRLFSIFPTSGPDVGGTEIYVLGNNLPNVSTYICRFDDTTLVNGTWLSDEKVLCISPHHNAGTVKVEISISRDLGFEVVKFDYTYNPVCPISACGSLNNPKRGSCSMGECNCFVPWTGSDCDQLGIAPKIDLTQKVISLLEGQTFELQLNISEGTNPVQWSLLTFPSGMLMDSSGRLTWKNVPASSNPYTVVVKCSNTFGESVLKFNVSVPPSYNAILDDVSKGPFVQTRSVLISGKIIWLVDNPHIRNSQIPVILQIRSNYGTRKITLMTPPLDAKGIFYTHFQPFSSEVGLTELDVKHPAKSDEFKVQQSWTVYGLRINLNPSSIQEYVGIHRYFSFITMSNIGVDPLSNIQILQVDAPFNIKLNSKAFSITNCSLNVLNCSITNLSPGQTIDVNATLEAQEPYSGYFDVVSETKENVIATAQLTFTFQQKTPIFRVSRPQISASVSRGSIHNEEVLITNIGLKAATNVKPILPNSTLISLVSFATNTSVLTNPFQPGLTLGSGETATLTFSFIPSITESLGDVEGFISVNALETGATISFKFIIVSTNQIDLTVRVEDEYTYFGENKPLLADARISLTSKYGGETTLIKSNSTGYATFKNIAEGYYVLYTSADKHLPDSRVIFASFGENSHVTVFLQRTAVTYSWVVKPVPFEDRYDITLEADFTTNVPIPVVTMEPTQIDLETLENGLVSAVQFKITNHGLIAAKGFQFNLPAADSHSFLQLTMNNKDIGDVPANTTLYAVMNVYVNETARTKFLQESSSRKKRSIVQCFNMLMKAVYYYICDKKRFNELMTTLDNSKVCDADVKPGNRINGVFRPWLAPGWGSGSDLTKGTTVVTPVNCNCAFNYPWTCWKAVRTVVNCIKIFYSINKLETGSYILKCFTKLETIVKCVQLFIECQFKGASSGRSKRSAELSKEELGPVLAHRSMAIYEYYKLGSEYIGNNEWFYLEEPPTRWWAEVFEPIFSETSDGGTVVTTTEFDSVLKSPLPSNATVDMVRRLVLRYNDSFYSWEKGDLTSKEGRINYDKVQQFEKNIKAYENEAKQSNKESIADWYIEADDNFNNAQEKPEQGVCAKVRIQIQQRMTLTRTGFEATLILENGETSRLSNIKVEILITTFGTNSSEATDKFAIGKPKLDGITDVTGSGELQTGMKGQATWLIIPFSSAAPTNDVQYNVGGTLYYSIGNENMTVPLFPDTITVKPDPKLIVNYFMEKYVYSDDPFTPAIEPAVPFVLGILVSNEGYGTATSLKITSSQPEIIDNEKGLLVNFQIIGTKIKNQIVSPSLTINFGDVGPHSTQSAKWILTCSLSGTFSNFSATFQNTNPLGDPRLSVLEKVEFHELLHSVMIDYPSSDLVTDFLIVDPETKLNLWPHLVYDSSNGTNPLNVSSCNASITSETSSQTRILANCTTGGWIYLRVISNALQQISDALRNSTKRIDTENNVWIQTINKKSYLQIFDFLPNAGSYSYEIFFTKLNLYPPVFILNVYNISISESTSKGTEVAQLMAIDQDSDNITYFISPDTLQSNLPFTLDPQTAILKTSMLLDREDTESYSLTVLARDSGSPQKTGTAFVLINVVDENDNAPQISGVEPLIVLESVAQPGFIIGFVKVTDSDKGINTETDVLLKGDADMLKYNTSSGELSVKIPLTNLIGNHEFSLVATDKGTPPLKTTFNFTLKVTRINQFKPKFNQTDYIFFCNETKALGIIVGQVEAFDEDDPNELLTFEIVDTSPQSPFTIDSLTGNIVNSQAIRCSGNGTSYSFQVSVTDNGAPPTGRFSSTSRVTIYVLDVNDHPPTFTDKAFNVKIKENSFGEISLITLNVTDKDCGQNGLVESYGLKVLFPNITNPSSIFKLRELPGGVEVVLIASLDREEYSEYLLEITATDSGTPPLTSSANVTVSVEDENDCIPVFSQNSSNITISMSTPVNAILYTFNASDCDENSELKYSMESNSSHEPTFFNLQGASGILRLSKSLKERNFSSVTLNIKAFDGKFHSQPFHLIISISDKNTYPPEFEHKFQTFYLNETTPVGYRIATLTAIDKDNPAVYYDILEGNENGIFSMDMLTGILTLVKSLDFENRKTHKLIIIAYDDTDKAKSLNGTSEVVIEVLNINEFPPEFVNVSGDVFIKVEEAKLIDKIYQVVAKDKDNDSISFYITKSEDSSHFMLDSKTGWLSVIKPLNMSKSSQIMIQIVAQDNGNPQLQSYLAVTIVILPAERNVSTTPVTHVPLTTTTPNPNSATPVYITLLFYVNVILQHFWNNFF